VGFFNRHGYFASMTVQNLGALACVKIFVVMENVVFVGQWQVATTAGGVIRFGGLAIGSNAAYITDCP